jgi:hypothetical protein
MSRNLVDSWFWKLENSRSRAHNLVRAFLLCDNMMRERKRKRQGKGRQRERAKSTFP